MPILPTVATATLLTTLAVIGGCGFDRVDCVADVELSWQDGASSTALTGAVGDAIEASYRIENRGERTAPALLLQTFTTLGPSEPSRFVPGPAGGELWERTLRLELEPGVREVCVAATVQRIRESDPPDPTPGNNTICRGVEVELPGTDGPIGQEKTEAPPAPRWPTTEKEQS